VVGFLVAALIYPLMAVSSMLPALLIPGPVMLPQLIQVSLSLFIIESTLYLLVSSRRLDGTLMGTCFALIHSRNSTSRTNKEAVMS
jgi:hypothetical protein